MEAGIAFLLAIMVMTVRQRRGPRWEFFQLVAKAGTEAFFGSAIYFAISIEVASIYMLVNKDYGISTKNLGASEAQIALAVAVVCVIPLLYPMTLLSTRLFHPESDARKPVERSQAISTRSRNFRTTLFCILAVLFFYPFLSQCIHNWAPSRIGEGKGTGGETLATEEQWHKFEAMCAVSVSRLTRVEGWMLAICEVTASIIIFLFTIWLAVGAGGRTMLAQDRECEDERRLTVVLLRIQRLEKVWKSSAAVRLLLLLAPAVLCGPLLWCIFRLRSMHSIALESMGRDYTGNEWGFGQVVGIVIFSPVVTDMVFAAWEARSLFAEDR